MDPNQKIISTLDYMGYKILICFCFVLDFSVRVYVRLSVTKS